jgi:hypothetical protein
MLQSRFIRNAFHVPIVVPEEFVGTVLDPAGDIGVGWAATGRVVLETAIGRWVVRRSDDNPIGHPIVAATIPT